MLLHVFSDENLPDANQAKGKTDVKDSNKVPVKVLRKFGFNVCS